MRFSLGFDSPDKFSREAVIRLRAQRGGLAGFVLPPLRCGHRLACVLGARQVPVLTAHASTAFPKNAAASILTSILKSSFSLMPHASAATLNRSFDVPHPKQWTDL